ncbi:hypothetical protein CRM22_002906 [Opisthorchis felineus]|uniref:Virilizer N-terminal domain-containing protein n=1 Tax=Opisthorchis felineus TaxID=147828 RepID=A0A4S2M3P9_OPIFE|nr:hypothetical protein CRM22_002906 [Opisthorchis felineus]
MAGPYIVFFDTFVHNGQTQENTDCVRFKSGVQLLELRILPFGSVVESNLSDEAIIGATNPASFDVTLYSNSRTNCVVLQNIISHHFDEKNGINCITLKEPVHSNFLLFRGRYSTLTVAIFGIPALSLNQTLPPETNLSVPPPQLGLTTPASSAPTYQTTETPIFVQSAATALASSTDVQPSWSGESAGSLSQQKQPPSQSKQLSIDTVISRNERPHTPFAADEEKKDDISEPQPDGGGLYEDGEIQDIDYEEISSNEEIFSDADDADLAEEDRHSTDLFRENDPCFNRCFWRFNPWTMASKGETGSANERLRIPDPTMTLFQFHCWLLERSEQADLERLEEKATASPDEDVQDMTPAPPVDGPPRLAPPPSDISVCATSAQYLLSLIQRFGPTLNAPLQEDWVEEMENLEQHLAPGLAFLYQSDKHSFQVVTEALIIWVYAGLDLSTALRQLNSACIVRHLMAGVKLTGLVTGTICSQIAWSLLYPSLSTTIKSTESHLDILQVQHLLLNLLESPLITTPLRLVICRALDQTTRLSVGMDAFLGRECHVPAVDGNSLPSKVTVPLAEETMMDVTDPQSRMDVGQLEAVGDIQVASTAAQENNQVTEVGDIANEKVDTEQELVSVGCMPSTNRTPYQRLVFLFSASRNARVTHAYQCLLNKIHAYELFLEFHELIKTLRNAGLEGDFPQQWFKLEHKLASYLSEIAQILQNAEEILANPRTRLPCPMLLEEGKRVCHDPYPDLCSLMDSTAFLEDMAWLAGQFSRVEPEQLEPMDTTGPTDPSTTSYPSAPEPNLFISTCRIHRSQAIWSCFERLLSIMFSEVNSLLLLASRPEPTTLLLHSLLTTLTDELHSMELDGTGLEEMIVDRVVLGLELAYKLETVRYVDLLIDCTRKKGILSVVSQLSLPMEDRVKLEPTLRNALFGLARLCTSSLGSVTFGLTNTELVETVKSIISSSAPVWVADVLTMDDYFAPLLMLVEAFANSEANASISTRTKSSDNLKENESAEKATDVMPSAPSDPVPAGGIRATLRQLIFNPLELSVLVNTIVLTVLRHSDRMGYLDRYGPRLAQLVTAEHLWEEHLDESAALNALTRLESFSRSAAPLLRWLRDCPTRPAAMNLITMCDAQLLSADAFIWFLNQLKPVITELEEALDSLLGLEVADDLVNAAGSITPSSAGRKQLPNQGIIAGRSLPPAGLLLLRVIRTHVCGSPPSKDVLPCTARPEQQVVLGRNLALIELFSANGLHKLSSLLQKLSEYFLLQCQALVCQASCSLDLLGISTLNSNISLVFGMLEAAVHLVSQLLITILRVRGEDFRDMTPIRPLCHAYATTIYAVAPPGPAANQLRRLRRTAVAGLLAYGTGNTPTNLSVKDIEKSPWVSVCREVISFTIAAPLYYLPGLKLLLELLPLPLPIYTIEPLDDAKQKKLRSARDQWSVYLIGLAPELTGLVELLGGTDPTQSNPLYTALQQLITRLADLGYPCATFLSTSCLDSLFAVWDELTEEQRKMPSSAAVADGSNAEDSDKASNPARLDNTTTVSASIGEASLPAMTADNSQTTVTVRTPSARLMLNSVVSSETDINVELSASTDPMALTTGVQPSSCKFTDLDDPSELASALSLFYANLQVPACRFALLYLLRQSYAPRDLSLRGSKSTEESQQKPERIRKGQLLTLADSILSVCSEKAPHVRVQMLLLKCLALLVSPSLALNGFTNSGDDHLLWDGHNQVCNEVKLVEGLPDNAFCQELITILVKHVITPERDMTTLPAALLPLLLLSQHDSGFLLVQSALDSPVAQLNGQHLFANMVQRVNDCFSAENPDCQATLAGCLSLLQSLLVGRTTLPLTFSSESSGTEVNQMMDKLRRLHISGARVRDWLGWTSGGDEGKPVRDLHALLEMLADDEPSLEYLRSGMKNLLSLLSEEFDVPACEERALDSSALPKPRPIEELFASRPYFVSLMTSSASVSEEDYRRMFIARWCLYNRFSGSRSVIDVPGDTSDTVPYLVTCNLSELAAGHCNTPSIRDELLKCGRQRDSAETAIRHQKRRRGQNSIIETGRTSKKFVAPMRGRGFMLRAGPGTSGGSTGTSNSGSTGSISGSSRLDPFRSRPLNTSRPPSLHVDDFTKLVKDDTVIEDVSRSRLYRDGRNFRGRGSRINSGRGASTNVSSSGALHPTLPFAFGVPALNPLSATALLPGWPNIARTFPLFPPNMDSRNTPGRRDRQLR